MKSNKINEMPYLGVSEEMIKEAAEELGVEFPGQLKEIWKVSNGLELPGGWLFHPVFDISNPRKKSNHIVYENTKARWNELLNGTGQPAKLADFIIQRVRYV